MKFLFEFTSCFAPSVRSESEEENMYRRREVSEAFAPLSACTIVDEGEGCSPRRRSRGKLHESKSGSMAVSHWKPSLTAISEDKIVFVVAGKRERTLRSGEKVARKGGGKGRVRYYHQENNDNNEYRRSPAPAVLPTFAPTAFFF